MFTVEYLLLFMFVIGWTFSMYITYVSSSKEDVFLTPFVGIVMSSMFAFFSGLVVGDMFL